MLSATPHTPYSSLSGSQILMSHRGKKESAAQKSRLHEIRRRAETISIKLSTRSSKRAFGDFDSSPVLVSCMGTLRMPQTVPGQRFAYIKALKGRSPIVSNHTVQRNGW